MSKLSNALHSALGFMKAEAPEVSAVLAKGRADAQAVLDKATADAAKLTSAKKSGDLKAALDVVVTAVNAQIAAQPAVPPETPPSA